MAGNNIAALRRAVGGMSAADVDTSIEAWKDGSESLSNVATQLALSAPLIRKGFGQKSKSGLAAETALNELRAKVLRRQTDMQDAKEALEGVVAEMRRAEQANAGMPASAPGPAPTFTYNGTPGDETDEIQAIKRHAAQTRLHNQQVTAFNQSDEEAGVRVAALNREYDEASTVLARIHGEPVGPGPGPGPVGPGPVGPGAVGPGPGPGAVGPGPGPGPVGPGPGPGPVGPGPGPVGPGPGAVGPGPGPDVTTPGLTGLGVLGGLGVRGLLSGATPNVTGPGQQVARPIGNTGRTGAGGLLGRGGAGAGRGAAVPGQAVGGSRGTGGRDGRAGGRAGVPGSAAGRAGGRKGKQDDDPNAQHLEIEEDWLDDDGQYPGVID